MRSLRNAKGEELESVEPGDPFEMMGLRTVPNAGDTISRYGRPREAFEPSTGRTS